MTQVVQKSPTGVEKFSIRYAHVGYPVGHRGSPIAAAMPLTSEDVMFCAVSTSHYSYSFYIYI